MKRTCSPIAFAAIAVCLITVSQPARAQDGSIRVKDSVLDKRVDINLDNADIRYALKLIFNAVAANYTLDPAVQGSVTATLHDVPFRTALEAVLKAGSTSGALTYRVEDRIYHVSPRSNPEPTLPAAKPDNEPAPKTRSRVARIDLNFIDPYDVSQVIGGTVFQSRWGTRALLYGGMFGQGGMGGSTGQGGRFGENSSGGIGGGNGFGGSQGFGGNGLGGNLGSGQPGGSPGRDR